MAMHTLSGLPAVEDTTNKVECMLNETHLQKAGEYLRVSIPKEELFKSSRQIIEQAMGRDDKLFIDVAIAWQEEHLDYDEYISRLSVLYAEAYSEEDLDTLIAFAQSEAGQKSKERQLNLFLKGHGVVQEMLEPHADALTAALDAALDKEEAQSKEHLDGLA